MKKVIVLCLFTCAFVAVSAFAQQNKVVVIPLNKTVVCPAATGNAIADTSMYGYCWYLSQGGISCDTVCNDLGGKNLAYAAEGEWADNCDAAGADDVSTWFYNNGNPGNWLGLTGLTGFHTLGHGYPGDIYSGKCSTGPTTLAGAYPGETNVGSTRNLVCPCFVSR